MRRALQAQLRFISSNAALIVLCMGGGCIYILPYLSSYLYIPMKEVMHLSNTEIGLMGSALGFTSMLFYWPGGWLADRAPPRKLIVLSLVLNALLGFWLATFPAFGVLMVIQLLMGVFLTLTFWSSMIKMTRLMARPDQQGRYFGFLEGGRNLATVLLVIAGLYLFDRLGGSSYGLRWTIILFSVGLLGIAILSWFVLPESARSSADTELDVARMPVLQAVSGVVRIPAVWLVMAIILCAYTTSVGISYFTPYATEVYQQSAVFGGMLYTIMVWIGAIASPAAGFLADRWTTSRTTLWLLLMLALGLLLFVIVPGGPHLFYLLLLNSIAIGCAIYALRGIYYALLEEGAIPLALTGMATGLISLVGYTPDVFIPALAGHLLDRYPEGGLGYRYFFLVLALFAFAGMGLTLVFRNKVSQINKAA